MAEVVKKKKKKTVEQRILTEQITELWLDDGGVWKSREQDVWDNVKGLMYKKTR